MRIKEVPRLVFTGPPGGGKTDAQIRVAKRLRRCGIWAVLVPEVDTFVHNQGIDTRALIGDVESCFIYELNVLKLQLALENSLLAMAQRMPQDKVVLLCDRGDLDGKVYMGEKLYASVLEGILGVTEEELLARYYAVFHLATAAQASDKLYIKKKKKNKRRTETPEQARALEEPTRSVWSAHSYRRIIESSKVGPNGHRRPISFAAKTDILFEEVCLALSQFYGEPIGPEAGKPREVRAY